MQERQPIGRGGDGKHTCPTIFSNWMINSSLKILWSSRKKIEWSDCFRFFRCFQCLNLKRHIHRLYYWQVEFKLNWRLVCASHTLLNGILTCSENNYTFQPIGMKSSAHSRSKGCSSLFPEHYSIKFTMSALILHFVLNFSRPYYGLIKNIIEKEK